MPEPAHNLKSEAEIKAENDAKIDALLDAIAAKAAESREPSDDGEQTQ